MASSRARSRVCAKFRAEAFRRMEARVDLTPRITMPTTMPTTASVTISCNKLKPRTPRAASFASLAVNTGLAPHEKDEWRGGRPPGKGRVRPARVKRQGSCQGRGGELPRGIAEGGGGEASRAVTVCDRRGKHASQPRPAQGGSADNYSSHQPARETRFTTARRATSR